ncbi:MAG: hypothetical protein ABSB99_08665 [Acidimicrobiales bacterium]
MLKWLRRCALVGAVGMAGALAACGGGSSAGTNTTTATSAPPSSRNPGWTGEYFWQAPTATNGLSDDTVLLTLLQSASGVTGTWTETATIAQDALGLNGDETAIPPNNSFPVDVEVTGTFSLTLQVENEPRPVFQVTVPVADIGTQVLYGLILSYTPYGGGIDTVSFTRVSGAQQYDAAASAIAQWCESGGDCGKS